MNRLRTHKQIEEWLNTYSISNYIIRPTRVVDVVGDVIFTPEVTMSTLPVQFGTVEGCFDCYSVGLTSLEGLPSYVGDCFYLTSKIKSLSSIHKVVKQINGSWFCYVPEFDHRVSVRTDGTLWSWGSNTYGQIGALRNMPCCSPPTFSVPKVCNHTHLLGLLLVTGIVHINLDNDGPIVKIMNKHLATGDIVAAQDELIDAGFINQAKL